MVPLQPGLDLLPAGRWTDPDVARTRRAERVTHSLLQRQHRTPARKIAGRKTDDLGFGSLVVAPELYAGSVFERNEQPGHCRVPFEAAGHKIQLVHDQGVE